MDDEEPPTKRIRLAGVQPMNSVETPSASSRGPDESPSKRICLTPITDRLPHSRSSRRVTLIQQLTDRLFQEVNFEQLTEVHNVALALLQESCSEKMLVHAAAFVVAHDQMFTRLYSALPDDETVPDTAIRNIDCFDLIATLMSERQEGYCGFCCDHARARLESEVSKCAEQLAGRCLRKVSGVSGHRFAASCVDDFMHFAMMLTNNAIGKPCVREVVGPKVVRELRKAGYTECYITLNAIEEKTPIVVPLCGHAFELSVFMPLCFIQRAGRCGVCRAPFAWTETAYRRLSSGCAYKFCKDLEQRPLLASQPLAQYIADFSCLAVEAAFSTNVTNDDPGEISNMIFSCWYSLHARGFKHALPDDLKDAVAVALRERKEREAALEAALAEPDDDIEVVDEDHTLEEGEESPIGVEESADP